MVAFKTLAVLQNCPVNFWHIKSEMRLLESQEQRLITTMRCDAMRWWMYRKEGPRRAWHRQLNVPRRAIKENQQERTNKQLAEEIRPSFHSCIETARAQRSYRYRIQAKSNTTDTLFQRETSHCTRLGTRAGAVWTQHNPWKKSWWINQELADTLRGSRPGVQSASVIVTLLMTS